MFSDEKYFALVAELKALSNTLGVTDLGREFMTKHAEIFGDAARHPRSSAETSGQEG